MGHWIDKDTPRTGLSLLSRGNIQTLVEFVRNPSFRHTVSCRPLLLLRDWSLITGRGGYKTGGGGHMKFYPYEKGGGGRKSFRHAEGGAQQVLG